jgi:hypothetical protein
MAPGQRIVCADVGIQAKKNKGAMNYLSYAFVAPICMAITNVVQKLVVSDDKIHSGVFMVLSDCIYSIPT